MKTRPQTINWLLAALAMERGTEAVLKRQAQNERLEMTFRQEIALHLMETKEHGEAIEACLKANEVDVSSISSAGERHLIPLVSIHGEEGVNELICTYSTGHFQMAFYRSLQAAAEVWGEDSIVELCNSILPDEERMAAWLKDNLPMVVRHQLYRTDGETPPKGPQN